MSREQEIRAARDIMKEVRATEALVNPTANPDTVTEVVRGFEIVKWDAYGRTWEHVGTFRNTELGLRQAMADLKWFQERHPKYLYQINALISHSPPKELTQPENQPADDDKSTPTPQVDAEPATQEANGNTGE